MKQLKKHYLIKILWKKKKLNNSIRRSLNFETNKKYKIKNSKHLKFLNKDGKTSPKTDFFSKEELQIKSCPPKNINHRFKKKTKNKKKLGNGSTNKINKSYKYPNIKAVNSGGISQNNNKNSLNIYLSNNSTQKICKNNVVSYSQSDCNSDKKNLNITKNEKTYISVELNNLEYIKAIEIDKRKFWQYYSSLIHCKQLILFTFVNRNDYNIFELKINLFLLTISISLIVNALFFDDNTMHKIYNDKGKYDFLYQIPKTIYSSLISFMLNYIFKALALSQNDVLNLKKQSRKLIKSKVKDVLVAIKKKMIIFYLIGFIVLIFIWYYLAAFGAVYYNTQKQLFIDTLVSFIIQMSYPFIISIIPSALRMYALKDKRHKRRCIYKISQIVSII